MIFKNARLIFPNGISDGLDVVAESGIITAIRPQSPAMGEQIVDLENNYLAPGFIDIHVHGAMGRDAMEASPEAFRAICDYHASGGTTALLLTTATAPMKAILDVVRAARSCRSSIKQIAGVHVEGPFISKAKAGAQRASLMRKPTKKFYAPLLEHCDVIKRVTIAPELTGAIEFIEELRANNISVSGGHSDAWEDEARAAFEHGMQSVTHTFNCMSTTRRRGIDRVAGLLEFAISEPQIICELIADGHHVSPTLMTMLYRAKNYTGICLVTDATAGAGLPDGAKFSLYGTKCITETGVCLLADRSALAGSASRMIDLVRTMVTKVGVPLHEAIAMATDTPAFVVGLTSKGQFKIGGDADLVVISSELEVLRTFVAGEEVFRS
ncbi:MAG TPA: N-acetylglucosamine-6-phosphate deacetylase [Chthoniobacterales bacterium]|jgi:N-acetylglucosamine-6-phosphate deacetylase|nr:N-acetylglucosamine-6-phosphate deacetylase [Chthoniobacterales bacterium]